MPAFQLLIDGKLCDGAQTMAVCNPANETTVAECPRASEAQALQAVAAARAAFPSWSATTLDERRQIVLRMAASVERNVDELARWLTLEQGKPLADARVETQATAAFLRYFASLDLPVQLIEDSELRRVEAHRRPLGVVVGITPWNFPLMLFACKVAPALLAGNTVVMKPAPTTPLSSLRVSALWAALLPPGVFNVITDQNDLGGVLSSHPDVRKISFTGSTATGRKIMASAAPSIKRLTLELGGNDAAIVLDDIDVEEAAPKIFAGAFFNAGQACLAIKRLYVHERVHDALCAALARIAEAVVLGDGLRDGVQMGPLQNRMQCERVAALIDDARGHATIHAGGTRVAGPGYFIRPTIISGVQEGDRIVDEEQFGPVLPVIRYRDLDDAVQRANATSYGLGASVWGRDPQRTRAVAARLEAGSVFINKHLDFGPGLPFGGAKQSGIGVEFCADGFLEFTQLQIVNIAKD